MAKAREWGRAHPALSVVAIALLAFLLGKGSASSGSGVEASLSAARADAAGEVAGLESDLSDLEEDYASLRNENARLTRQVEQMNARRELPSLVGSARAFALKLETRYAWNANVEYRYSTEPAGTILSQSPAPGTMMRFGATYTVVVAKALPKVSDVVGMWRARAETALARWNVVVVEQVSDQQPGRVIAMSPSPGAGLAPGATVTLTVAKKAPPPPPVPAAPSTSAGAGCTPGYSPCLPPDSDYDCSGGSGDGPKYTGYVTVTGSDPYGLDSDNDGAGCES
ncbi:MAG: PASTA domain-containing protein [Actinomycetota bacterium]|nr:PASTA domain-containing protein [Actinomycetota bacterium]